MGNAVSIEQTQSNVILIPFHNQHAGVVRLIQHFRDRFIDVLKTIMTDVGTIVSRMPLGQAVPNQISVEGDINYDRFISIYKQHVEFYRPTQLEHLNPIDFHIDTDGQVFIVCEQSGNLEEQGVPKFVKAVYNNPPNLVEDLLSGKEENLSALWDFVPAAFIVVGDGE